MRYRIIQKKTGVDLGLYKAKSHKKAIEKLAITHGFKDIKDVPHIDEKDLELIKS